MLWQLQPLENVLADVIDRHTVCYNRLPAYYTIFFRLNYIDPLKLNFSFFFFFAVLQFSFIR